MSVLWSVCGAVCVVAIAGTIISSLMPDGNTKKIMTLIIGAFMVCSIIVPVKSAVTEFNVSTTKIPNEATVTASADEIYTEALISHTEKSLEQTLAGFLKSENINFNRIRFYLKQDPNIGIIIDRVCIYIDKKDNTHVFRMKEITEEHFDTTPFVIAEN